MTAKSKSEEKVQNYRILTIDEEIRSGKYPNAKTLSKKLEISDRTIARDIEYLRDMYNAPIEWDAKRNGYYYSEPNFFIKRIILTEGELFSVALFDQLLVQYRNTPVENNLRKIFTKIRESLPDNITLNSAFLPSQAGISFIPDPLITIDPKVFENIFIALATHQTITVEYRAIEHTEYIKRTLNPYHVLCQHSFWYILAYCHEKTEAENPRMYSFSRIRNVQLTKKNFVLPNNFKPENYFDEEMGVFISKEKPYSFELLFDKSVGGLALERKFNSTQKIKQNKDGSVLVTFETNQINEVLHLVLGHGATVTVLNPPELITLVKNEIGKMSKMYKK